MDAVQKETSGETLELERIVVPPEIAKALGRGLRQSLGSPLQEINSCLPSLMNKPYYATIEDSVKRITNVLNNLEKAKKVEVLSFAGGNEFRFSKETEEKDPKPGKVLMDKNITPELINALNHTIRNPLFIVSGFADNDQSKEAGRIVDSCSQIEKIIKSLDNAQEIIISTDTKGNTTITPFLSNSSHTLRLW